MTIDGPALLSERDLQVSAELARRTETWSQRGAAVLHVVRDGQVIAAFSLEDEIRDGSRQAVDELHAAGVKLLMITGDGRQVAEAVARSPR